MEDGIDRSMHFLNNCDVKKKAENKNVVCDYLYVCVPKKKEGIKTINDCIITDNKEKAFKMLEEPNFEINIYKRV
jgi:hypothetical protein